MEVKKMKIKVAVVAQKKNLLEILIVLKERIAVYEKIAKIPMMFKHILLK